MLGQGGAYHDGCHSGVAGQVQGQPQQPRLFIRKGGQGAVERQERGRVHELGIQPLSALVEVVGVLSLGEASTGQVVGEEVDVLEIPVAELIGLRHLVIEVLRHRQPVVPSGRQR